jgi:hypothetical protein
MIGGFRRLLSPVWVQAGTRPPQARQIDPTGKLLLVIGNRVKPQNKKYFAFPEGRNRAYLLPSRPGKRGVGRRYQRGTGSGGREGYD